MPKKQSEDLGARMTFALSSLRNNPVLLIPDLVRFFMVYILTIALYKAVGMTKVIQIFLLGNAQQALVQHLSAFLSTITTQSLLRIIFAILGFIVVTFVIGVGIETIRFGLILQCIEKKKASLKEAWKARNGYFWRILWMKLIIYFFFSIAVILLSLFSLPLYAFLSQKATLIIFYLLGLLIFVVLTLIFLFRYAAMFIENRSAVNSIKSSFLLFKNAPLYVFTVWLLLSLMGIAVFIFTAVINRIGGALQSAVPQVAIVYMLAFVTAFIILLLWLVYSLWKDLFIFKSYPKQ